MINVRVSCGCPVETASQGLEEEIRLLGLEPIVTNVIIRCVYEGGDRALGEAVVQMFEKERDHDITVFYDKEEQAKSARRAQRKAERAERNAKLHGHK